MRLDTFIIPQDIDQGKLYAYVRRMLPELPEYIIREAFDRRDVKVDGKRVGKDALITPGAEVRVYTREHTAKPLVSVVYEDERVLVIVKPVGVSCEADAKGGKTITQLAQEATSAPTEPLLCHRLDNPTDGLLLLAKDMPTCEALQEAFSKHRIHKTYTCLVRGTPVPEHAVLHAYLQKDAARSKVRITSQYAQGSKEIVTEYTVLSGGECARLSVALHTGRTHQIRAHMAFIGHPLLGDDLYGDRAFNRAHHAKRLMLTATELSFDIDGTLAYLNDKVFSYRPQF